MTAPSSQAILDSSGRPMRQPETIYVTPSSPNPWYGAAGPGDRFTRQQLAAMARVKLDPETVAAITVRRNATTREFWWPKGDPAPVFEFDCPILSRRRDGRLNIIAPAGVPAIVLDDGWVARPKKPAGWGRKSR
jgi:hypothetical protein